jgi:hypothetical protein
VRCERAIRRRLAVSECDAALPGRL